jgi:hypothetical protein
LVNVICSDRLIFDGTSSIFACENARNCSKNAGNCSENGGNCSENGRLSTEIIGNASKIGRNCSENSANCSENTRLSTEIAMLGREHVGLGSINAKLESENSGRAM